MADHARVREYYEGNTRGFLRFGGASGRTGSLHRSLRLPGVTTSTQSIDAIHHILLGLLVDLGAVRPRQRRGGNGAKPALVADLGCGVGATMQWMFEHADVETVGITVSPYQAQVAEARLRSRGRVVEGSFTRGADLRRMAGDRALDAAIMIESFVHTAEPEALFRALSRQMKPEGVLIICDDMPTTRLLREIRSPSGRARLNRRLAADFRLGWQIAGFRSAREIVRLGAGTGWRLVQSLDLTEYVVTNRPRDYLARAAAGPARLMGLRGHWWQNVTGGAALQRLIRRRLVRYRLLVFEKVAPPSFSGSSGRGRPSRGRSRS